MTRSILASAATTLAFAVVLCGPAYPLGLNVSLSAGASSSADNSGSQANTNLKLGADTGKSTPSSTGTASTGTDTASSGGAQAAPAAASDNAAGIATVINLIASSNWTTHSLANITTTSNATNVDVGAWLDSQTSAELQQAVSANAGSVGDLQTAISTNTAISAWLAVNGATPDQVIAAGQSANGSLVLFTNTSAQ